MTDEELIKRLRSVHTSADDEAAADRMEALVKERDALTRRNEHWRRESDRAIHELTTRAERLEVAGRAYREATRHLKPCPETSANFDAALKGEKP